MLRFLKEVVWKVSSDNSQVVLEWSQVPVGRLLEQDLPLGLVDVETVDLLVKKGDTADDCFWVEDFRSGIA